MLALHLYSLVPSRRDFPAADEICGTIKAPHSDFARMDIWRNRHLRQNNRQLGLERRILRSGYRRILPNGERT
jgi:hypothetical protein